jgi:ATP-dependent RNA helicase SUPV3L1/SUV3
LTQLLGAWEKRDASQLPGVQELGRAVSPSVRSRWQQSIGAAPSGEAGEALLRLEMAAEVPTPAEQLDARRALQLKLLTKRGEPGPDQTWGQDAATVLAAAHEPGNARRLQNALKALLRK